MNTHAELDNAGESKKERRKLRDPRKPCGNDHRTENNQINIRIMGITKYDVPWIYISDDSECDNHEIARVTASSGAQVE